MSEYSKETIAEQRKWIFEFKRNKESQMDAGDFSELLADALGEIERLQNESIIIHEKATEDAAAALYWYKKAKEISISHDLFENEAIEWLKKRIATLEAERRWRPVSEKPDESGWYLTAYIGYGFPDTDYYDDKTGWIMDVDFWMPMPELPEVKSD